MHGRRDVSSLLQRLCSLADRENEGTGIPRKKRGRERMGEEGSSAEGHKERGRVTGE